MAPSAEEVDKAYWEQELAGSIVDAEFELVDGWAKRKVDQLYADEVVSSATGFAVFVWGDGDRWLAQPKLAYDEAMNPSKRAKAIPTPARAGKGSGSGPSGGSKGKGSPSKGETAGKGNYETVYVPALVLGSNGP